MLGIYTVHSAGHYLLDELCLGLALHPPDLDDPTPITTDHTTRKGRLD